MAVDQRKVLAEFLGVDIVNMQPYKLFLDDERHPPQSKDWMPCPWVIVRSVEAAKGHVEQHGIPYYMTLDHDLGWWAGKPLPTGMDFVKWLVEFDMDKRQIDIEEFHFDVHSMNPVGAENMKQHLQGYLRKLFREKYQPKESPSGGS